MIHCTKEGKKLSLMVLSRATDFYLEHDSVKQDRCGLRDSFLERLLLRFIL
jgi:hypothetical protein